MPAWKQTKETKQVKHHRTLNINNLANNLTKGQNVPSGTTWMTTKKNNSTKKHRHANKLSRKARKPKAHIHMEPNLAARQQKQNLICRTQSRTYWNEYTYMMNKAKKRQTTKAKPHMQNTKPHGLEWIYLH